MRFFCIYVLLTFFPLASFANSVKSNVPDSQATTLNKDSHIENKEIALLKEQVVALKAQNDTIKSFQSSSYDAIYSLAILLISSTFGLTGLLFLFSWFSNFKITDKEIKRIDGLFSDLKNQFDGETLRVRTELSTNFQSSTEQHSTLNKNLKELEGLMLNKFKDILHLLDVKDNGNALQIDALKRDLYFHLVNLKRLETESWRGKKFSVMTLIGFSDTLELAINADNESMIMQSLEDINDYLSELILRSETEFDEWIINKLTNASVLISQYKMVTPVNQDNLANLYSIFKAHLDLFKIKDK